MKTLTSKKRCICGESTLLPLCDGSHKHQDWSCGAIVEHAAHAFIASPSLINMADRLAHRFAGVSLHAHSEELRAEHLVIVTDGHGLELIKKLKLRVTATRTQVIGVGVESEALTWAFPETQVISLPEQNQGQLWTRVENTVKSDIAHTKTGERPKVFLSHAVKDEGRLHPVIEELRSQFGLEIFVCADSIPSGSNWRDELRQELMQCDLFVFVSSRASNDSVFCGFEAGIATALKKPVRIISIDGAQIPTHLQDIQGTDICRLLSRKPWLTEPAAILESFLEVMGPNTLEG